MEENAKQLKRLLNKHKVGRIQDIPSWVDKNLAEVYQKAAYELNSVGC